MIRRVRSQVDDFHSRVYQQVVAIGQRVDGEESAPRQAARQQHRQNIPSSSISEYYKLNLTIPIIDHLSSELENRFNNDCSKHLIEFTKLLPADVIKSTSQLSPSDFPSLLEVYGSDLPAARSFDVELDLWQNKWTNNRVLAQELSIPEKTLKHTDSDYFPNIHTLIIINFWLLSL